MEKTFDDDESSFSVNLTNFSESEVTKTGQEGEEDFARCFWAYFTSSKINGNAAGTVRKGSFAVNSEAQLPPTRT